MVCLSQVKQSKQFIKYKTHLKQAKPKFKSQFLLENYIAVGTFPHYYSMLLHNFSFVKSTLFIYRFNWIKLTCQSDGQNIYYFNPISGYLALNKKTLK